MKAPEPFRCPEEWKLSRQQERLFEALMDNYGALDKETLRHAMGSQAGDSDIVRVMICYIRKKLAPFNVTISSGYRRGFWIDEETRAALRAGAVSLPRQAEAA